MNDIEKVEAAGWLFYHLDDGFGPPGWWCCKGLFTDPQMETSVFPTKAEAARAAIESFPELSK